MSDHSVVIELDRPGVEGLDAVVDALRRWQRDDLSLQLHPGDVGWFWRFGDDATAAAVRTWRREGELVAVGLLDGADLVRLALAPEVRQDDDVARQLVADVGDPALGVLGEGAASVEAPGGVLLHQRLGEVGWAAGEAWVPLRRDLVEEVPEPGVRVAVVGPDEAESAAVVLRGSFDRSTFSAERWRAMASGSPYVDARCLVVHGEDGAPAATVTVWSAGVGRPGLLEPMGVHRDHRGRGLGRAITLAGAAALRDMGSSVAEVCTMAANTGGVATYESAGFVRLPERRDRTRSA